MPILGGYISTTHGWRSQFQIISAFLAPCVILIFFLVPESAYNRPAIFNTDFIAEDNVSELEESLGASGDAQAVRNAGEKESGIPSGTEPVVSGNSDGEEKKKTFTEDLRLYNGRFSDESFFKLLLAPLVLFLYPATIWSFLFQGSFITWVCCPCSGVWLSHALMFLHLKGIAVSVILARLFAGPPTNFTPEQLGYMYCAPFIGALMAYFVGSFLSDSSVKWMARKNNNVYEPEFRILMVIPVAIFGLPGLYAYGYVADAHMHWIVPSVLYGFLTFAVVMSCTATYTYILDAHRDISVEMLVSMLLLKNFFAFGSTYFIIDWVDVDVRPLSQYSTSNRQRLGRVLISVLLSGAHQSLLRHRGHSDSYLCFVCLHIPLRESPAGLHE